MRGLILGVLGLGVVCLAVWAYSENYATRSAADEVAQLNQDIAKAKARLRVLNAEWAWQNRPERLAELVQMNFEELQLLNLTPNHFGSVDDLPLAGMTLSEQTDVMSRAGGQ